MKLRSLGAKSAAVCPDPGFRAVRRVPGREIFYTLTEAKVLIEQWRRQYNTVRPHSALGYRPPAPEATMRTPNSGFIMSPALS